MRCFSTGSASAFTSAMEGATRPSIRARARTASVRAWLARGPGPQAIIAPSVADIFRNNCLKIGLLPVELPQDVVRKIMDAITDDPSIEIVVDVVDRRVAVPALDIDEPFDLSDFHHYRLLEGLDDIGLTLRHDDDIARFEAQRSTTAPWTPQVN